MFKYLGFKLISLKQYLVKNYALLAYLFAYLIYIKNAKEKFILVYTMGKVGSTTVANTLEKNLKDCSIYHIHWLNKENLVLDKQFHKKYYLRNRKRGVKLNVLPFYISQGFFLRNKIDINKSYKIVTLTRDPVAKEVSSFFQNATLFFGCSFNSKAEDAFDELANLFLKDYILKNKIDFIDANPLTWFDEELKEIFNIDVYQSQSPKDKGYTIFREQDVSVLLIRLEDLTRCFAEATTEFFGTEMKIDEKQNVGKEKIYNSEYKKFKNKIVLPDWYLDKMYNSKYAKHFYTDHEIISFRNKWSKSYVGKKV